MGPFSLAGPIGPASLPVAAAIPPPPPVAPEPVPMSEPSAQRVQPPARGEAIFDSNRFRAEPEPQAAEAELDPEEEVTGGIPDNFDPKQAATHAPAQTAETRKSAEAEGQQASDEIAAVLEAFLLSDTDRERAFARVQAEAALQAYATERLITGQTEPATIAALVPHLVAPFPKETPAAQRRGPVEPALSITL